MATQPPGATAPPTVTLPSLTPTAEQDQAAATLLAPTEEPATVIVPTVPATPSVMSPQQVTTTTAVLESDKEGPTTSTARVYVPPGSLLDRLTYNKPGIWGNKALYVGLAVAYIIVLALFLRLILLLAQD